MSRNPPTKILWPILPSQRRFLKFAPVLEGFCRFAHRALGRPAATPKDRTRRCYEDFMDPLCAQPGIWEDYTEGVYRRGDETYSEAQRTQFVEILRAVDCEPGTRLLDIGCGNGRLLDCAKAVGCDVAGLTLSRSQAAACQERGLDVRWCSFEQAAEVFADFIESRGAFDVVILNGSTEHFVSAQEAAAGTEEEARHRLYEVVAKLLKPGGRVLQTCIHQRVPLDPQKALQSPLRHEPGDVHFFASILVGFYSGWYPRIGSWEKAADDNGFRGGVVYDGTDDYYRTSKTWTHRLSKHMRRNRLFAARQMLRIFWKDPEFFFYAAMYWVFEPWTWQFRGGAKSPMVQLWLRFEKRLEEEKPS